MPQVECIGLPGCKCWFWSRDHLAPHFHAESPGEWEIRVFFMDEPARYDVVWELRTPAGRALRKFLARVAGHREALLAEWDAKVKVDEP